MITGKSIPAGRFAAPHRLEDTAGNHCTTKALCDLRRYDKSYIASSPICKPYAGLLQPRHKTHFPEVSVRLLTAAAMAYCLALCQVFAFRPRQKFSLQHHVFGRLQSPPCNRNSQVIHDNTCPNPSPKRIANKGIPFRLKIRTQVQR